MRISDWMYKHMIKALGKVLQKKENPPMPGAPPATDKTAKLQFIAWGDPQISCLSPLRSARVYAACQDIRRTVGVFDALVLLGDITEYGAWCEYRMTARLLNPVADKFRNIFAVSGNHDVRLRRYQKQVRRFFDFLALLPNGRVGSSAHYYSAFEVNGYPFLLLGADKTCFEGSYISDAQLDFIRKKLAEIPDGMPVFVFNHQPLKHTNGLPLTFLGRGKWRGSVGNESDKLRAVLQTHRNVIFITGHLHYCTSQYTYEDLGNIKAVSAPTVGVLNHGAFSKNTQGLVFTVYEDSILVQSRMFGEGENTPDDIPNASFEILLS